MFSVATCLLLAGVFATAALGKFLDQDGTAAALRSFGVSSRVVRPLTPALPALEAAIAIALLVPQAGRIGPIGAAVLLAVFTFVVGRTVARGEHLDCHCFGQIHSAPAGPVTLIRNVVLLGLAIAVTVTGTTSIPSTVGDAETTAIALAAVSLLALTLLGVSSTLWETNRRLVAEAAAPRLEGLPPGTPAPPFSALDAEGGRHTLASLLDRGRPLFVVLVHETCEPCRALVPRLSDWAPSLDADLTLVVVSAGPFPSPSGDALRLLAASGFEVADGFATVSTPAGIGISRDGSILGPPAIGAFAIESAIRALLVDAGGMARHVRA